MTDRDAPPPLPDDVADLVRAERGRAAPPDGAKDDVRAGLAALLAGPTGGGGDAGNAGSGRSPVRRTVSMPRVVVIATTTFVLGAAVGALRERRSDVVPLAIAPAASSTPPATAVASVASPPLPDAPPVVVPSVATPSSRATPLVKSTPDADAGPRDLSLAKERALIDRARAAIARGRAADAEEALDEHARVFPKGQLAEEREALAVQALAQAGRIREATERAALFRKRWPDSVLTPVVDEALR